MLTNLERLKKDIESMAKFNSTPDEGLTRLSFTNADREAREYIKYEMTKAGLQVYEDAAGTIVGRLDGQLKDAPAVLIGSHYDSVRNGGNFDGPAGVVSALEVARSLKENGIHLKFPVEVIAMIEEEGSRFGGGLLASRAMAGQVTRNDLNIFKDNQGISIAEAMSSFGFNPDNIHKAARNPKDIKAFLELHIEQGPILEHEGLDIGIVQYIVGICEVEVIITGRPDHAGTTPMNLRIDALNAAAHIIHKISDFAEEEGTGTVGTVGILNVLPGSANIVPGKASFTIDVRSKNQSCIDNIIKKVNDLLKQLSLKKHIQYEIKEKLSVPPVKLNEKIKNDFSDNCKSLAFRIVVC
jgi:allantoate deiminase